jgi:hypothetical protein
MTPSIPGGVATTLGRRRTTAIVAVALMLSGFGLSGCGAVRAIKKVAASVESNKTTIDQFTSTMKSSEATPFEATYVTTGSTPATIVYAVQPPKALAFKATAINSSSATGGVNNLDIVVNSTGEYACTPPSSSGSGSSSAWSCQKLPRQKAAVQNKIFDFYTPAHWVSFLRDFALAAGFAGDKVSSSNLTVNGFSMHCVDFVASGVAGKSTICTTAQGILGYVKVASESTSFRIKSYSTSPSASLFQLPAGAKITTVKTGSK